MNNSSFISLVEELEKEAIKKYPSADKPFSLLDCMSNLQKDGKITFEDFSNFKYIWKLRNESLSNKNDPESVPNEASEMAIYLKEKIQ